MENIQENRADFFGTASIYDVCFKLAPPIILAQLIQALYNIVDSYFVGQSSNTALTALAVIYPLQCFIIAIGMGVGVGVNALMARYYGEKKLQEADNIGGTGMLMAIAGWCCFALLTLVFLEHYVRTSTSSEEVLKQSLNYGYVTCLGCLPLLLESVWTKVHQAEGNMKRPMYAQGAGALTNIVLDKILIFGWGSIPALGVLGAAIATVIGQTVAALTVISGGYRQIPNASWLKEGAIAIANAGMPAFVMNALFTFYVSGLNLILVSFSEAAVTVLGLYYRIQTFFFLPMIALQNCLLPFWSYNYGAKNYARCKEFLYKALMLGSCLMGLAALAFICLPVEMLKYFSQNLEVLQVGEVAFPIIGLCFIPANCGLIFCNFFLSVGLSKGSVALIVLRQIALMLPLAWFLGRWGLNYVWACFPITETIVAFLGYLLYRHNSSKIW